MPLNSFSTPVSSSQDNSSLGNPLDILKVLLDTANSAQQVQQQAPSVGQEAQTIATRNAYQKGVDKALQEQGYKHGSEAVMSGMDPNEIANHPSMQPQGQGAQALAALVNPNTAPVNQIPQVPNTGLLSKLLGIDLQPELTAQRLSNAGAVQKIQAGQPAEIAVPLAQAAEINQKIAGAVPLQPADIVKLNIDSYSAALKANQDAYANSNTEVANLSKTLDILQQGRSTFGKAFGGSSDIMNTLKSVITAKTAVNQQIGKNQAILMNNAPKVTGQKSDNSTNTVGKYSFTKG